MCNCNKFLKKNKHKQKLSHSLNPLSICFQLISPYRVQFIFFMQFRIIFKQSNTGARIKATLSMHKDRYSILCKYCDLVIIYYTIFCLPLSLILNFKLLIYVTIRTLTTLLMQKVQNKKKSFIKCIKSNHTALK